VIVPAFYDGGTVWPRATFTNAAGTYQVLGVTLNGQTQMVANLQPSSWLVAGPSMGPGFVRIDPANTNRFITSDGRRYFPIGHNVAGMLIPQRMWSAFWRSSAPRGRTGRAFG